MIIEAVLTTQPIDRQGVLPPDVATHAGAVVEFAGLVRGEEAGRPIGALEYEAYSPMAERMMRQIATDLAASHPCLLVQVVHRIGIVRVGQAAIRLVVAARHRAEALAMVTSFMDRLKEDVPIWKRRALSAAELPTGGDPP